MVIRMGAPPSNGTAAGARPAGGTPQGGAPAGVNPQGGGGGSRGGGARVIPKDQQDRMLFDGQSATFFSYLIGKVGAEKVKEMIQSCREGKDSEEIVTGPDMLGSEFDKIEADWMNYVKTLKPEAPPEMRMRVNPDRPRNLPEQSGVSKP